MNMLLYTHNQNPKFEESNMDKSSWEYKKWEVKARLELAEKMGINEAGATMPFSEGEIWRHEIYEDGDVISHIYGGKSIMRKGCVTPYEGV